MATFNSLRVLSVFPVRTLYVTSDSENDTVVYGICPKIWRRLPCEGIILLNIVNTPTTGVSDAALVSIDTSRLASQATSSSSTSTGARALLNGSGD